MELKYRMYGLVNYQLSGIQKGIQFGHAVVEYGLKYFNTDEYKRWANFDKTFIILNGGTTNSSIENPGTLNIHSALISEMCINFAEFYEPDLGDQLTSVVFIVNEKVFDKEKYPDYEAQFYDYEEWKNQFEDTPENINKIILIRSFLKQFNLA